jgi:hypothetical protein
MIWQPDPPLVGWSLVVEDRLALDDAWGEVRILAPDGRVARSWRCWVALDQPGLPLSWRGPDGRTRGFGGPSHPRLDMARSRAGQLLDGLLREAQGAMQGVILAEREAANADRGA